MSQHPYDEHLAYGDDYRDTRSEGSTDRSLVGDTFNKLKTKYQQSSHGQSQPYGSGNQDYDGRPPASQGSQPYGYGGENRPPSSQGSQQYYGAQTQFPPSQGQDPYGKPQGKPDLVSKLFSGLQGTVQSIGGDVAGLLGTQYPTQQYGQSGPQGQYAQGSNRTRFGSFASDKPGNDVKWYVDGAGYFYAVSKALEGARDSIWILDWWLSPELYLRRPPSKNEQFRLDRMLQRAAQRGVRINIIVYKEVTQALSLSSSHTKHALEALHPNIAVLRHPDHLPDARTGESSLVSALEGLRLDAAESSKMGADTLKALYGFNPEDSTVLYWAHHEKLLIVDSNLVFMGGLDLCFGRWDLYQHPIADAHGSDLEEIVWPGQDYNDNRVLDFQNVAQPFQNKLDRTRNSRMGWSDISIGLRGPVVNDLKFHFVNRWNFIFNQKYNRGDPRYTSLSMSDRQPGAQGPPPTQGQPYAQQNMPPHQAYGGTPSQHPQQSPPQPAWQASAAPQAPSFLAGSSQPYRPPPQSTLQPPQQPYGGAALQSPPPPGTQPSWQSTSRPHTPETSPSMSSQYQQYQPPDTSSYQAYRPESAQGSVQQQPYYPPPPPGAPPSMWSSPQHQDAAQSHTQAGYNPAAPHVPENVAELPSPPPYGHAAPGQPQTYQPTSTSRGLDDQYDEGDQYGSDRGLGSSFDRYRQQGQGLGNELKTFGSMLGGQLQDRVQHAQGSFLGGRGSSRGVMSCQVVRSCTKWSNGTPTEHSVQDAYIETIQAAQHFIYIENQFFITATGDHQHPVQNQIGKALLDRILRAARNGEKFKVMVNVPSVPGFAGDLRDDSSLGTRAIMDFQYKSINRGGNSILELIAKAGYNPMDYIRFYNLRNYDRINADNTMKRIEEQSGVSYEEARREHDDFVGAGYDARGEQTGVTPTNPGSRYQQYQAAAQRIANPAARGRWESVSECYMLGGTDIRNVPWDGPPESEIDAFVSEELYIHTKVLIADDKVVICGSANLNDRSQLGTHDSEIALVIADSASVDSYMAGRPWRASRFAASLRRQLFRKHLGLIKPQDLHRPDANFEPVGVPNSYDWGSPEDNVVSDPLSDTFQSLWNTRARTNTDIYRRVFHVVPDDNINSWTSYQEFFEYYFHNADVEAQGNYQQGTQSRYQWGHVIREDFPGGVKEVKDLLSQVKGTVVEMPLTFLQNEDIAHQGITLNPLTEPVYT